MDTIDEKRAELEHMECRVQWHREHQERVKALRDEIQVWERQRRGYDAEKLRCDAPKD